MNENVLKEKSFSYAVRIVNAHRFICEKEKAFELGKQLLKSGTAVGALYREAEHAESTADFIHKLSIAQKECDESMYWLELLHATESIDAKSFKSIHADAKELIKIITAILTTTKKNANSAN